MVEQNRVLIRKNSGWNSKLCLNFIEYNNSKCKTKYELRILLIVVFCYKLGNELYVFDILENCNNWLSKMNTCHKHTLCKHNASTISNVILTIQGYTYPPTRKRSSSSMQESLFSLLPYVHLILRKIRYMQRFLCNLLLLDQQLQSNFNSNWGLIFQWTNETIF